jgi:hypothetical protein
MISATPKSYKPSSDCFSGENQMMLKLKTCTYCVIGLTFECGPVPGTTSA